MRKYALPLLAVLLALACVPALAQSISGTIEGRVTDEQGGALPGAIVTLTGKMGNRTTTADRVRTSPRCRNSGSSKPSIATGGMIHLIVFRTKHIARLGRTINPANCASPRDIRTTSIPARALPGLRPVNASSADAIGITTTNPVATTVPRQMRTPAHTVTPVASHTPCSRKMSPT